MDSQKTFDIRQRLWGCQANLFHLLVVAALLTLLMLGARELWTQEGRWADITWEMLVRGDYWHPYLDGFNYYDKPLLSYWAAVSLTWLTGIFNEWSLRFPSALAGILSVWCVFRIGKRSANPQVGLVAGWLMVSTFFVIYWSRVISADMLNVAGFLIAITWYFENRQRSDFWRYTVFFLLLALASLLKGPVAMAIVAITILPDFFMENRWRIHLNPRVILALLPAIALYLTPFLYSHFHNPQHYGDSGLGKVYQENFLRYFQPFDHKEPFYVYLYYLPLYLLPWTLFFIPACVDAVKRWHSLSDSARWAALATLLVFLFMTFSGSRRNYYTLMMVPFAILFTANWIVSDGVHTTRCRIAAWVCGVFIALYFLIFAIVMPIFAQHGPLHRLAETVRHEASQLASWDKWQLVMVHTNNKMGFYLKSAHPSTGIHGDNFAKEFPAFLKAHPHTIVITRTSALHHVKPALKGFKAIHEPANQLDQWLGHKGGNDTWVFVPKH
ncbi:MAG: hypothetical protein DHS20C10_04340 [marine bacterium B5-7]|nr:MAG: hypothetical protein DHS20C10_04340 [marine bacterium B5-7]